METYPYRHEPLTDFNLQENIDEYKEGLKTVEGYLGETYPLVIGGERIQSEETKVSLNPADHDEVIGTIHQADVQDCKKAMAVALSTFETWSRVDPMFRADVLFKSAAILRRRRFEFAALLTKEAGKPYAEADADVAEAIDFLEYYGREMLRIREKDKEVLSRRNVERNEYRFIPLGVGVVITPFNFPLAILAGMTSAAVVTGNTVLLKPASTTQTIAYKMLEVFEEAGLPDGVINFVPCEGKEAGDYMVKHPRTRFVSFTGSKDVGVSIYENAAKVRRGQIWFKRVIAEMGGKGAVIVDEDYDVEEAVDILIKSAFGYSGQKCSAATRAFVHEKIYEEFLALLKLKTEKLKVNDPATPATFMGPLIDEKAFKKVMSYIETGKEEGTLLTGGRGDDSEGYYVEPTIFIDLKAKARVMQEEIFGPVLCVNKFKKFEDAIRKANDTQYGLTGAVLSNSREHLELARHEFHVGNLYFNRGCTGAIVGYQPFGGFNMSGTNAKAGGPEYLTLHMQAKTVTEQY